MTKANAIVSASGGTVGSNLGRNILKSVSNGNGGVSKSAGNTFKNGEVFETSFRNKSGIEIGVLAETVVEGDTLILKDVSIYSNIGDIKNQVGVKEFVQLKNIVSQSAKEQGFKVLKIIAERVQNSTSANPGHGIDITVDLTKIK